MLTSFHIVPKFRDTYAKIGSDIFVKWLETAKKESNGQGLTFVGKFVEVLQLTDGDKVIQNALGQYFVNNVVGNTKELLSYWKQLETHFMRHTHVGDLVAHHLLEALKTEAR